MKKNSADYIIVTIMASKILPFIFTLTTIIALSVSAAFAADINSLIKEGLDSKTASIDVSSANIAPQSAIDAFQSFIKENPEYYYVNTKVQCKYSGNTAATLEVTYTDNSTEQDFDSIVDSIVSGASQCSSTYEKVKYVHDYLVENTEYDYTLSKFSAYDLLVNKTGVCQAYAYAFKHIMDKLGIECEYAESPNMQHMWNVVKVDGNWYNVDCAWSNTTKIPGSPIGESYMLKSDSFFRTVGYFDWKTTNNTACTDTKYDSNF